MMEIDSPVFVNQLWLFTVSQRLNKQVTTIRKQYQNLLTIFSQSLMRSTLSQ